MRIFSKKHPPVTYIPDGHWAMAVDRSEADPMFFRINEWAKSIKGHQDYPWRIGLLAPIEPDFDYSSINSDDSPYSKLDERAMPLMQAGLDSILVLVVTARDFREWIFYSRDLETVRPRVDALCAEFSHIGLVCRSERDPKWKLVSQLCDW